jgi:hypothetical protein
MKLREQHPELNIPKYPKTEDKETLKRVLTSWKERVYKIESRQKNLKGYLYMVIFGIQFFFTKFLRFDNLSGFFEDQMFFIEKYESLINKISEKYRTVNSVISILEPEKNTKIEVLEKNPEIKLVFYLIFYSIVIIIIRQFLRQNSFDNMLKNKILGAISGKESLFDNIGSNLINTFIDPHRRNGQILENTIGSRQNRKPESSNDESTKDKQKVSNISENHKIMKPRFEE